VFVSAVREGVPVKPGEARRPVSWEYYQELLSEVERAQRQYDLALEEASETMRGWSDIAAKASYAGSMQALARTLQLAKSRLDAVTPIDERDAGAPTRRNGKAPIDEIIATALARADLFTLELWRDDALVRLIPDVAGPLDPKAEVERLSDAGEMGELRLIQGSRGSADERCAAIYLLRRRR
jgi:hypothetical protein